MSRTLPRGLRIGLAVGEASVTAVLKTRGSAWATSVPVAVGADMASAFAGAIERIAADLARQLGRDTAGAQVDVALLPPLADTRLIRLPPLRRPEAEAVIRRDAARHFVGGSAPRIVTAIPGQNGNGDTPGTAFVAAAVRVSTVDALHGAIRAAGWRLARVAPAHGAWLAAAGSADAVLAVQDDVVHILTVDGTRCSGVRRAPLGLPDQTLASIGAGPGRAMVWAEPGDRATLVTLLSRAGWEVESGRASTAAEAAALFARRSRLELIPPAVRAERSRRNRRHAIRAAVLALLLLGGAAIIELWGVRRELDAVRAERAAIRAEVEPLLATRDSIDRVSERTQAIERLQATSPLWTRALFDLALLLPRDAHITSLHTVGDTLVVEATGARAGAALQALRRAGSLADIRLVGAVERDLEDGATATERFRFTARLKPPAGLASPPADGNAGGGAP